MDQIKVAYLVNFIRFTTWPDLNEKDRKSPLVITLLDNSQFDNLINQAFPDQKCDGRPVVIQTISRWNANDQQQQAMLKASHVVFMHDRSMAELKAVRQVESNLTFLLIGDMPEFAESSGMIGLKQTLSGVSFTVNISQIRQARLHVSSKVLRLGVTVRSKDEK